MASEEELSLADTNRGSSMIGNSATDGTASANGNTFTAYEHVTREEKVRKNEKASGHTRDDATEVLWETQAFWMRTRTQMKGVAEEAQKKVGGYVKDTKVQLDEYIEEFFSEEQTEDRKRAMAKAVSVLRTGLTSCHNNVDGLLVSAFDQPVPEVGLPEEMELHGNVTASTDGEYTAQSEYRRSARNSYLKRSNSLTLEREDEATSIEEDSVDPRYGYHSDGRGSPKTDGEESTFEELSDNPGTSADVSEDDAKEDDPKNEDTKKGILSADSEDESVLRFKEELYRKFDEMEKREVKKALDAIVKQSAGVPQSWKKKKKKKEQLPVPDVIDKHADKQKGNGAQREEASVDMTRETEEEPQSRNKNDHLPELEVIDKHEEEHIGNGVQREEVSFDKIREAVKGAIDDPNENTCLEEELDLSKPMGSSSATFLGIPDNPPKATGFNDPDIFEILDDPEFETSIFSVRSNMTGKSYQPSYSEVIAIIDPYTGTETIDCSAVVEERDEEETREYADTIPTTEMIDLTMYDLNQTSSTLLDV